MSDERVHYALANPLSKLLDKPRAEFSRADLLEIIEQQKIERIGFHYTALDGKLKELKIPLSSRAQAEMILAEGERVDGSSLFKGMVDAALSDLYVVPVYRSAFLNPFEPTSLDFVCRFVTKNGELAPFAPDTILINAARSFEQRTGLQMCSLGELEFFLIGEDKQQIFLAQRQHGYHAASPFIKSGPILNQMIHHITQISGDVKYAHSEVGYIDAIRSNLPEIQGKCGEQLEIEYLPRPIDEAADNLVLGRWLIRNIAYQNGCVATFAPKIEEGVAGNGMHVHMALMRDGHNVMTTEDGSVSADARKLIGGLCEYASALTAFGNTVSSAYLRLVPNQEAPTRVCWSDLNRSAMIRVPLGWSKVSDLARLVNPQETDSYTRTGERQTVELRSPDGSALVHLLHAGLVMAADWGFANAEALRLADDLYVTGNIFEDPELMARLPSLPGSCVASGRKLLAERELFERDGIFPPSVIDWLARRLAAQRDEDMNQRLVDMPADDRLAETRKIMHRCLHEH